MAGQRALYAFGTARGAYPDQQGLLGDTPGLNGIDVVPESCVGPDFLGRDYLQGIANFAVCCTQSAVFLLMIKILLDLQTDEPATIAEVVRHSGYIDSITIQGADGTSYKPASPFEQGLL